MENTVNFDYGSYMYIEVLKQLVRDYINNIKLNTPNQEKNKIGYDKADKLLEDVESFLISYSLSSNFFTVLESKQVSSLWSVLREDSMENVFSFIIHLTIKMKLVYGAHWDKLIEDISNSFDLLGDSISNTRTLNQSQYEIDQDIITQLPNKHNILTLFKRNHWLVIIALITLMGSYK